LRAAGLYLHAVCRKHFLFATHLVAIVDIFMSRFDADFLRLAAVFRIMMQRR